MAAVEIPYRVVDATAPGVDAVAVIPSDTTLLTQIARAFYVGGAGNISILTPGGATVSFVAVPAGVILPVMAQRVNNTGTTATNIVAIF